MLIVKSRINNTRRYLFESNAQPVSAEELARGQYINVPGKLESTLVLSKNHPPFDQKEYDRWKEVMKDCSSHRELKFAYDDSYTALMKFLNIYQKEYRIHTIEIQG
jgi:hypothetical protein